MQPFIPGLCFWTQQIDLFLLNFYHFSWSHWTPDDVKPLLRARLASRLPWLWKWALLKSRVFIPSKLFFLFVNPIMTSVPLQHWEPPSAIRLVRTRFLSLSSIPIFEYLWFRIRRLRQTCNALMSSGVWNKQLGTGKQARTLSRVWNYKPEHVARSGASIFFLFIGILRCSASFADNYTPSGALTLAVSYTELKSVSALIHLWHN